MKSIGEIVEDKSQRLIEVQNGADGFRALLYFNNKLSSLIASKGAGWEHVSICFLEDKNTPTWGEMCILKDYLFYEDEAVIQIHPPKSDYVNNRNNCLHLWRCYYKEMVLPPSVLVGLRPNQTEREFMRELKKAYIEAGEESPV